MTIPSRGISGAAAGAHDVAGFVDVYANPDLMDVKVKDLPVLGTGDALEDMLPEIPACLTKYFFRNKIALFCTFSRHFYRDPFVIFRIH